MNSNVASNGVKLRPITVIFIVAQLVLLGVELFTHYDTTVRQGALVSTNIITALAILLFDRWLQRQGNRLTVISYALLAGAVWLDALGNFQHLYAGFWWWDRLTHTVGGMALSAGLIDYFLARRQVGMQASWNVAAWLGLLVGQLVGSIYEISEWLGDFWFDTHRVTGLYDAPHDLFQNLIGGLLVLALMRAFRRRE